MNKTLLQNGNVRGRERRSLYSFVLYLNNRKSLVPMVDKRPIVKGQLCTTKKDNDKKAVEAMNRSTQTQQK